MIVSQDCPICNGMKMITIHSKIIIDNIESETSEAVPGYALLSYIDNPDIKIGEIFCNDCGVIFHISSIM